MEGTILYVGGNGPGNYTTIQQAIDAASAGDTVYVYDDQAPYREHLIISEAILLQGEDQNTTVIDGNYTGDVITLHADHACITGFTIMNSGDDWPRSAGIRIDADDVVLSQLTCQHTEAGVILTASTGSMITGCTLQYNDVGIILENGSTTNTIADNTILSSSFEYQIAVVSCPNNTIEGNFITNPDDMGIYVYDSPGTRLRNNTVIGCEKGIVFVTSNTSEITGNILQNNTVYGMSIGTFTGLTIADNTFFHDGLLLYQCHDNTVTDNTVNGKPLIYLENRDDQTISQQAGQIILVNCSYFTIRDITIQDVDIAVQCWGCTNCVVYNNVLTSDLCAVYLSGCSHTEVISNILSDSHWNIFLYLMYIDNCDQITVTDNDVTFTDEFTSIYFANSNTVVFSRNTLHGEHAHAYNGFGCGYSKDITITDNTLESGSIELAACARATVRGNTLQSGAIGLDSCRSVRVLHNDIHPKNGGIYLRDNILTTLRENTITNGTQAVSLEGCLFTHLIGNSFINCGDEPAAFTNSLRSTWVHNYWGSSLSHPKVIHGTYNIIISDFPPHVITIPMINIDMIPKRTP
jgi:parallel beta-helix repeat protein